MMNSYRYLLILFFLSSGSLRSDAQILTQGTVTFERTINLKQYTELEKEAQSTGSQPVYTGVRYARAYFSLSFNEQESLYLFLNNSETDNDRYNLMGSVGKQNRVYTDFRNATVRAGKNIYNTDFAIRDTLLPYKWKISREFRTISGYVCRKATTVIFDSVVVVAFYTTAIKSRSGPESFNGLPGMILGLVIPRLYTTWFATEVGPLAQKISPERPEKTVDYKFINDLIRKNQARADKNSLYFKWWALL